MRKDQICPQTRFCGFEMSTLFAVNDRPCKRMLVGKKIKKEKIIQNKYNFVISQSPLTVLLIFVCKIVLFILIRNKSPRLLITNVCKLGLQAPFLMSDLWGLFFAKVFEEFKTDQSQLIM